MKNIFVLSLIFSVGSTFAQTNKSNSIVLSAGQKIKVVNTINADAEVTMVVQLKNNMVSNSTIVVTGENASGYTLTSTVNRLKGSMEVMGKLQEFDSEKESDKETEMGKAVAESINKPVKVSINRSTGTLEFEKEPGSQEKEDGMEEMMSQLASGGEDPSVSGAFIIIPKGKSAGDNWTQNDTVKDIRTKTIYTLKSIEKNVATITFISDSKVNNSVDMQGSQMDITMNTSITGIIIADPTTGLVKKRTSEADVTGNIDMMGQSMPMTGKRKIVSEYSIDN